MMYLRPFIPPPLPKLPDPDIWFLEHQRRHEARLRLGKQIKKILVDITRGWWGPIDVHCPHESQIKDSKFNNLHIHFCQECFDALWWECELPYPRKEGG